MSSQRRYLCGVPKEHCVGGITATDQIVQNQKSFRGHSTTQTAFACKRRYLLKMGWKEIGSREFLPPDGGPVLVLDKKSRYGGKFVQGKGGDSGKRFMPEKRRQGNRGVII